MISDVELRKLKRKKIPTEIEETDYIYSCNHLVTLQTSPVASDRQVFWNVFFLTSVTLVTLEPFILKEV